MTEFSISRLGPEHANAISQCFVSVYGTTYANELFYHLKDLAAALESGALKSVGAFDEQGALVGHMAMVTPDPASIYPELGNTVVSPSARGGGLAWKVGAELRAWSEALGYSGFVHFPTTDHHIMQQQSVKAGFEVGLMLGYIPAQTDGQVKAESATRLRGAATIVYEPYGAEQPALGLFIPQRYAELVQTLAGATQLPRTWTASKGEITTKSVVTTRYLQKRDLRRIHVACVGQDVEEQLVMQPHNQAACTQLDCRLDDPGVDLVVEKAIGLGYRFCGWVPGRFDTDVLRLQQVDEACTDLKPGVVNPVAQNLLGEILDD